LSDDNNEVTRNNEQHVAKVIDTSVVLMVDKVLQAQVAPTKSIIQVQPQIHSVVAKMPERVVAMLNKVTPAPVAAAKRIIQMEPLLRLQHSLQS